MNKKLIFLIMILVVTQFPTLYAKNSNETSFQNYQSKKIERPMRILFIVGTFPWYTKVVIMNQITGLLDRGHDVYIYAEKRPAEHKVCPEVEKYGLIERTFYEDLPADLNSYDIIVAQYGDLAKKYINLKKEHGFTGKFVTFLRGADITSQAHVGNDAYRELFKDGDLFLPICQYFKYRLELIGCNPDKIAVQASGVDCEKFFCKKRPETLSRERIHLVSVGRLVEKKALSYVINAVDELLKNKYNIDYTIVGDGVEREKLELLIKKLRLKDRVKMTGWMSQKEILKILHDSHIFVLPSVTSKGGNQDAPINVLKEAMLTELPVVSTYHGGIIELVDSEVSGYLVPERDVDSLVQKIRMLLDNPSKWASMGKAGRKKVLEKYDMEKLNDQLEIIFLNLIEGK